MELAPDFFTYFDALTPLLDKDDMLMCISSWNDHGQVQPPTPNVIAVMTCHAIPNASFMLSI